MKQSINVLKEYFETGDKPTQQNYADLIDSLGMPMIGEIKAVSFGFAPDGWIKCNGQLLDPAQHPELFAMIGTTFGGDGITSFAVPDLQGRVPLGIGSGNGLSSYTIGQSGGDETIQLTEEQLPAHSHTGTIDSGATANVAIPASGSSANSSSPSGAFPGVDAAAPPYSTTSDTTMQAFTAPVSGSVTTNSTGNGTSITNVQPFLAVNYIIAVKGINPI
ncbi:phage tail protein [Pseudotenacibaculum haliotis]|uniref:Phage tail protein n=1 Tax=Pseudotenacibaculum haliotis TaxID=1862138 RepID=A0ABW5LXE3_9FLAO